MGLSKYVYEIVNCTDFEKPLNVGSQ